MDFATVPAAPPTRKNQRTTSWPAPISAKVPYQRGSRLILSALLCVSTDSDFIGGNCVSNPAKMASLNLRAGVNKIALTKGASPCHIRCHERSQVAYRDAQRSVHPHLGRSSEGLGDQRAALCGMGDLSLI